MCSNFADLNSENLCVNFLCKLLAVVVGSRYSCRCRYFRLKLVCCYLLLLVCCNLLTFIVFRVSDYKGGVLYIDICVVLVFPTAGTDVGVARMRNKGS